MARISVRPDSDARQGSSSYRPMAYSAPTPTPVCETPVPVDDPTAEIRQKYFSGLEELVDLHRDVGILNSRVADRKAAIKELEGRIVGLETTVASLVPLPLPPRPVKRPLSVAAVTPAPVRETRSEVVQEPPKKRSAPVERPPAETQKASVDSFLRKPVKEFKVPKRPVEVTKAVPPVKSKHRLNLIWSIL